MGLPEASSTSGKLPRRRKAVHHSPLTLAVSWDVARDSSGLHSKEV